MKRYNTIFILILSSFLLLAGCADENLKEGGKVSLHISAAIPAMTDSLVTRAAAETGSFLVALSTTASEYATNAKTYTATGSNNSYTFTPTTDNDLKIALLATSTPLTIYGQVGDIPYFYSGANTAINRGIISDLKLTYAYAKVAVRILKTGKAETAGSYTVSSDVLSLPKKGTASSYEWITNEAVPKLTASNDRPSTTNIAESTASSVDFTNVGMAVTPGAVTGNTDKLFILTETTASNKTYNVSSLAEGFTIEAGKAYLFTVDLDKGVVITGIDITSMNKEESEFRYPPAIYSLQDLKDFRDAWNTNGEGGFSSNAYGKWFDESTGIIKLVTDIDMNGEPWEPIKNFAGVFEGDSHTIRNLTVNNTSGEAGLFGNIQASTKSGSISTEIRNLNVENADISATEHCGVICGSSDNSRITSCNVSGVVVVNSTSGNAGGIVGNVTSANSWIQRCNALCSETSSITGATNAGGIVGNTEVDVFGCVVDNINSITATNVGSIVGTGGSGKNLYSCIASNITTLTGNCLTLPYGNATASDCYFTNVAGNTSGTGYVKYMEYLNGHCDLFNNALYTFYQSNSGEPYQAQYKFVGGRPSSLPPTLSKGEPVQQLPRTAGIYTGHELAAFSKAWNSGDGTEYNRYRSSNTVTIMNEIDMREIAYTAINNLSGTITGANGQQQTIANLSGADALLNAVSSLTVKDLILLNAETNLAGFVVSVNGTLRLEYCRRIGGTTGKIGNSAGGLVCFIGLKVSGPTCIACSVEDMKLASDGNAGGILGDIYGNGTVIGCTVANIQSNIGYRVGGFIGYAKEFSGVSFGSCIVHNLNLTSGIRGIFVGSRKPSDPNGTAPSLRYCFWNGTHETTKTVGEQPGSKVSVSNCSEVTSWDAEALQTLNDNLGQSGYEWQLQEGKDYPIVVRK